MFPLNLFLTLVVFFVYFYPIVGLLWLRGRFGDSSEGLLKLELFAGLGTRLTMIDNFILLAADFVGVGFLAGVFRELFGPSGGYISFITPNMFSGVGPATYFEYSSIYLGYLYGLVSGDKYFMYRNNAWLVPLLVLVTYVLLFGLCVVGLLLQRLGRPVVITFYFLAVLNSLFPLVLVFLQVFLFRGWFDYHGFATAALLIYFFFQLFFLRFNLRRLVELLAPNLLPKIYKFFRG